DLSQLASTALSRPYPAQLRAGVGASRRTQSADLGSPSRRRGNPLAGCTKWPANAYAEDAIFRVSRMSDDAQRWKDKYLSSLEQQEKLERRWESRLDLLRRGLVRSSLAAEGTDKAVDQCMQEMREILRRDDIDAALDGLLPRLEKAVLDSEQRRQQRAEQAAAALAALIEQLQRLQPPREVRKALKSLGKQLQDATSHHYLLPALLSQLSNLQGQALTVLQAPIQEQPGLLQRLFGSRSESDEAANSTTPAPVPEFED